MTDDSATAHAAPRSEAILVVDDEPIVGQVVAIHLRRGGFRNISPLVDSSLALDWIRKNRPSLVLLDLSMPRIGGVEILTQLQQDLDLQSTPVLIITASCDPEIRARVIQLGARGVLGKPIDAVELVHRVREVLGYW